MQSLTDLAASLLRAPLAQVSLLGESQQVVAAQHVGGADQAPAPAESPLQDSLCTVTAASGQSLVVDDARSHPWVRHLPSVTSGAVGSYLGAILRDSAGQILGSLCAYDSQPRTWSDSDVRTLSLLADSVSAELAQTALSDTAEAAAIRLHVATQAADLGSYSYDLATGELDWDERMMSLHGYDRDSFPGTIEAFERVTHPEDVAQVNSLMAQAIAEVGELNVEYRVLLRDGTTRWITARGRALPDMLGRPARIVGAAYDRSAERGLQDDLARLLETMPAGFLRVGNDWTVLFVNKAAEKVLSTAQDLVSHNLWDAFPEGRGTAFETEYRRAMDTRLPGMIEAYFEPLDRHFEVNVWPDPGGISIFFHDVSDRIRARGALEKANARLALLSRAGKRLTASLQPAEVLAELADIVVPELANLLVLAVVSDVAEMLGQPTVNDPTRLYAVHAVHADPALQVDLDESIGLAPLTTSARSGVGRAVRTGDVQAMDRLDDELLVDRATSAAQLEAMRNLNTGRSLSVPMRTPLGILGALSVMAAPGQELDQLLIVDLANRAGVALENALTFARQARAATELQRGLLPPAAEGIPGVEVAARYLPAVTGALAGGDFFKTVVVDGRLVAVLGDVMGHGAVSAARAGQLHSVIATLALEGHAPGALLARLAAGAEQILDLELATILVCIYDPATRALTTASAGHPAPLFAPVDGPAHYLDIEPGPPIGVPGGSFPELVCTLAAGSTMVLFSDGLVEQRGESISDGLERLRQAVNELRLPPEAVADHALAELGRIHGGEDDVALLVMSHV